MKDWLFTTRVRGSIKILKLFRKAKLRRFFCCGLTLLMMSCATTIPKETYLSSANLSGILRVAIIASAKAPDVTYSSTQSPTLLIIFPLFAIVEGAVRSSMDTDHAQQIGKRVDLNSIEDKITEVFSGPIASTGRFKTVERIKDKIKDEKLLSASGYDAIIWLTVSEISLDRMAGDYVSLHIHVRGQLKHLRSGKILWDREEQATSPEAHQLDYYKEHGLKELHALLEKTGKRLAYDFVYLN